MRIDRIASLRALAVLAGAAFLLGGCSIEGSQPVAQTPYVAPAPATPWTPPAPQAQTRKLVILHTNDEHSQLLGYGPQSLYPWLPKPDGTLEATDVPGIIGKIQAGTDTKTVGGIVRRQFLINKIRAQSQDPVLTVSAGDVMMGTILHAAYAANAAPDYLAMAVLGYDFGTLGNHEFDWGTGLLVNAIHSAQNTVFGGSVPIIASNIHFPDAFADPQHPTSDELAAKALQGLVGAGNSGAAIMPWATKTLSNGLKVGLLGGVGFDAASVAPLKAPISFSTPRDGASCTLKTECTAPADSCVLGKCVNSQDKDAHIAAMAADLQPQVDHLRQVEKVDVVILLSHSGLDEDKELGKQIKGLDVIIGGHSHDEVAPPEQIAHTVDGGKTIMVQAGDYGRKLGQLTLSVATDGAVTFVEAETKLHVIDHTLDAQIAADPAALTRAVKLTAGVIGPVLGGINAKMAPALGIPHVLYPIVHSDHDVLGELPNQDTNLNNLVSDGLRGVVAQGGCINPADGPIVSVVANGVMRQSLHFSPPNGSTPGDASFADLFSVTPLGASNFTSANSPFNMPGYPLVKFVLHPGQIFAGADVGVTKGLVNDSFFLSFGGMRVEYDPSLTPFDPATFDPLSRAAGGRVTKIEIPTNVAGTTWATIYQLDVNKPWAARWSGIAPDTGKFQVITNLYIAFFLAQYHLTPYASDGTTPITLPELYKTVLCIDMAQKLAGGQVCSESKPVFVPCYLTPGAGENHVPPWTGPELKEWAALMQYVTSNPMMPGATIPTGMYAGQIPDNPRVKAVTH